MNRVERHPGGWQDERNQGQQQQRKDKAESPQLAPALDLLQLDPHCTPSGLPAIWTAIGTIDFSLSFGLLG
ncbi:hypothetical protein [Bradyrhizobium sp. LMG 9283]|uniref:hypothetical protein n=1 Tax=Bradyrhizobium sp. LMG 9283 TaxID=592064 RepID=UPI003890CB31